MIPFWGHIIIFGILWCAKLGKFSYKNIFMLILYTTANFYIDTVIWSVSMSYLKTFLKWNHAVIPIGRRCCGIGWIGSKIHFVFRIVWLDSIDIVYVLDDVTCNTRSLLAEWNSISGCEVTLETIKLYFLKVYRIKNLNFEIVCFTKNIHKI